MYYLIIIFMIFIDIEIILNFFFKKFNLYDLVKSNNNCINL